MHIASSHTIDLCFVMFRCVIFRFPAMEMIRLKGWTSFVRFKNKAW